MTGAVLVASILADADRPLHGQEIVARSGGRIGRGTVYVYLEMLIDRGVVECSFPDLPLRRRDYWLNVGCRLQDGTEDVTP